MPLKQTTFENFVTIEKIAHDEQFLLLPQCFPVLVIGDRFNYRDFSNFWQNMFKVVCCRFLVCGKGLRINLPVENAMMWLKYKLTNKYFRTEMIIFYQEWTQSSCMWVTWYFCRISQSAFMWMKHHIGPNSQWIFGAQYSGAWSHIKCI